MSEYRFFKLDNVVKQVPVKNEVSIKKLLAKGFVEINEKGQRIEANADESVSKLEEELAQAKAENEELAAKLKKAEADVKKLKAELNKAVKEG